jgi:hypothetical protein
LKNNSYKTNGSLKLSPVFWQRIKIRFRKRFE